MIVQITVCLQIYILESSEFVSSHKHFSEVLPNKPLVATFVLVLCIYQNITMICQRTAVAYYNYFYLFVYDPH